MCKWLGPDRARTASMPGSPTATRVQRRSTGSDRGYLGLFGNETVVPGGLRAEAVRIFISAPYHAQVHLATGTEVGLVVKERRVQGAAVFDFGTPPKYQRTDDVILTYPCEGVAGTATKLLAEVPSPYSPRDLVSHPIGQSPYFFADERNHVSPTGQKTLIEVINLLVTELVLGATVAMLAVMTRENDANAPFLGVGFAYAAPDQPRKAATRYRVRATIRSENDNKTTLVDYTFSTG